MTDLPAAPSPGLTEARGWVASRVDDLSGTEVGQVHGFFVDAKDEKPSWLIVRQGRFRGTLVAVPLANCAAGGDRVWVAHLSETIRSAPVVDPTRPLLREHELTIGAHYGIGEGIGRPAAVVGRGEGSVTSQPAP